MPPPAEAMSCGLINSALMGAQQEGGGVEGGGWRSQVCGMWRSVTALSLRDKLETVHFPPTESSPPDILPGLKTVDTVRGGTMTVQLVG